MKPIIYSCEVFHERATATSHSFKYRVYVIGINALDISIKDNLWPLFAFNRRAFLSFYEKDYLKHRSEESLKTRILNSIGTNVAQNIEDVILITVPRICGYVFNPVNFYFCRSKSGDIKAAIVEVHNTFGEIFSYVLFQDNQIENSEYFTANFEKQFYVSPFYAVDGQYALKVKNVDYNLNISIELFQNNERVFIASLKGKGEILTTKSLCKALIIAPLSGFWTMMRIQYQALILFYQKKVSVIARDNIKIPPLTVTEPKIYDKIRECIIRYWASK